MDARQVIVMGAFGLFLHTLVFPFGTRFVVGWYDEGRIEEHWLASYIWFVFTIFLWPIVVGIVLGKLIKMEWVDAQLDKVGLSHVDRTPSAWDWTIDLRESRWVRVHLRDGSTIGGFYGTSSFASLHTSQRDIYLEQVWFLDEEGEFDAEMVNTDGVWIGHEMISHIVLQIGED